jgi:hypothetical protein
MLLLSTVIASQNLRKQKKDGKFGLLVISRGNYFSALFSRKMQYKKESAVGKKTKERNGRKQKQSERWK